VSKSLCTWEFLLSFTDVRGDSYGALFHRAIAPKESPQRNRPKGIAPKESPQRNRPKGIAPKESPQRNRKALPQAIAPHFPTFYSSASLTPNTSNLISKSDRRIFPQEA
jgi:hypothetical protein